MNHTSYNAQNERLKHEYIKHIQATKGYATKTIDGIVKALNRYEVFTRYLCFSKFNQFEAVKFKDNLLSQTNPKTGEPLSLSLVLHVVQPIQDFLKWLCSQKAYRTKINLTDIEYLNLTDKQKKIATARKEPLVPTLEQIKSVIDKMPYNTLIERRNRAILACLILTGARDGALISLKIKHIDTEQRLLKQEADSVNTKKSKTIYTYFYPLNDDGKIETILLDWIKELKETLLYGNNNALFPKTAVKNDDNHSFAVDGLTRDCWSTAQPIRDIVKQAFQNAGLDYFKPHSFRNTLVHYGQQICKNPEEFKAWSQNIGHSSPLTTFTSYGTIPPHRQGEIIRNLTANKHKDNASELLQQILAKLDK